MKILIVAHGFPPPIEGGIEVQIYHIARLLHERGNSISVICPTVDDPNYPSIGNSKSFDKKQSFNVYRVPCGLATNAGRPKFSRLFVFACYYIYVILKIRPENILCSIVLPYGPIISVINKFFKLKTSFQVHGSEVNNLHRRFRPITESIIFSFRNANKIFAMGNNQKNTLKKIGIDSRKIIVILDGTDPTVFKPGLETKFLEKRHNTNGKYIMLTVGHLEKRKGHDNVIKALSRIRETIPDIVYIIVGRGPMEKDLIELVNDLGLNKNVKFIGFVPYPELPFYYNLCDIFIMPSRNDNDDIEGYCLVYVEANSCQKPTIGGDSGGVYDAIIDGQTGLLVNPNDIQDIASKIVYLKNNRNISTQLGIHGRQRVIKELNYEYMAKRFHNTIMQMGQN